MMMDGQRWATAQRGMPTEDMGGSSGRVSVTGETVPFFYSSSGTRTADAGQAAGVVVEAVLAYAPIANSSGTEPATYDNSSLSFTSTAFTSEVKLSWKALEDLDRLPFAEKIAKVQSLVADVKTAQANNVPTPMANGDYVVDHRHGVLYGKKASTQTSLTSAAYKTIQKVSSLGSGSLAAQVQGNVAAAATDSGNPVKVGGTYNSTLPTYTNGQRGDAQITDRGALQANLAYLISGENQTINALGTFPKFVNSTTGKPTSVTYTSFTTQAIASSVPLTLVGLRVVNTTASARYLFLQNASSISGGATPSVAPVIVPANGGYNLPATELGGSGEVFSTALTIGNSSTLSTFTAGSAGDLIVTLYYTTATS